MINNIKKILNDTDNCNEIILTTKLEDEKLIIIFFSDGFLTVIDYFNEKLTRFNIHNISFRDYLNPTEYPDYLLKEIEKMEELKQLLFYIQLRFEHNSEAYEANHVIASFNEIYDKGFEPQSNGLTPEYVILQKENYTENIKRTELYDQKIQSIINGLTQLQLKVFCNKICDHKTEKEIAYELGISRTTVQSHWNAVVKKFRKEFPDFGQF